MSDLELTATQEIRLLTAAYEVPSRRMLAHLQTYIDSMVALPVFDRYAGQIDVDFDACDLLTIEVTPLSIQERVA